MKILVLGGTRFLGREIVRLLSETGYVDLTVISRKRLTGIKTIQFLQEEKTAGLRNLQGNYYDIVLDFIAYDIDSVKSVLNLIKFRKYIVVSTCWLNKLNPSKGMDEFITDIDQEALNAMPIVTKNYLLGKNSLEMFLRKNLADSQLSILRLPIVLGKDDHTGRLAFYVYRVLDEKGLILINGGSNLCQIAFVDSLATIILEYLKNCLHLEGSLFEALPKDLISPKELITVIGSAIEKPVKFKSYSSEYLKSHLPDYLEEEPLWREDIFVSTSRNLFNLFDMEFPLIQEWVRGESMEICKSISDKSGSTRKREMEFINRHD